MIRSKILVVGSEGFVGSYLMKEIEADRLDLKLGQDVRDGIDGKYKTIVFLACNQGETIADYNYNYEMYQALDDYRRRYPNTYLIYFSSAAIYYPISTYSQTKRLGEIYATRFKRHAIIRPSNIYGHGDGHGAPDRFMRGENVIFGDGEQVRDLIAIEQIVDGVVELMGHKLTGVFNYSTGKGVSINEAFKMFGEGKPIHKKVDVGVMGTQYSVLKPGRVDE